MRRVARSGAGRSASSPCFHGSPRTGLRSTPVRTRESPRQQRHHCFDSVLARTPGRQPSGEALNPSAVQAPRLCPQRVLKAVRLGCSRINTLGYWFPRTHLGGSSQDAALCPVSSDPGPPPGLHTGAETPRSRITWISPRRGRKATQNPATRRASASFNKVEMFVLD